MIFEHTMIEQYEKDNRNPALLHDMLKEYPKLYDYVFTTLDSCVGRHRVYVANVETKNGDRFIKVGYTKNTVKQRLSENRYKGKIYLVNVIHEEFFLVSLHSLQGTYRSICLAEFSTCL